LVSVKLFPLLINESQTPGYFKKKKIEVLDPFEEIKRCKK
jgi:hypothetical protein